MASRDATRAWFPAQKIKSWLGQFRAHYSDFCSVAEKGHAVPVTKGASVATGWLAAYNPDSVMFSASAVKIFACDLVTLGKSLS